MIIDRNGTKRKLRYRTIRRQESGGALKAKGSRAGSTPSSARTRRQETNRAHIDSTIFGSYRHWMVQNKREPGTTSERGS